MALEVQDRFRRPLPTGAVLADRRLWVTSDRARVVEDGDPTAAFLLAAPGNPIAAEECARLGLQIVDGVVHLPPEEKQAPKPADKARAKPGDK